MTAVLLVDNTRLWIEELPSCYIHDLDVSAFCMRKGPAVQQGGWTEVPRMLG